MQKINVMFDKEVRSFVTISEFRRAAFPLYQFKFTVYNLYLNTMVHIMILSVSHMQPFLQWDCRPLSSFTLTICSFEMISVSLGREKNIPNSLLNKR